ncbi:hypothetical protein JIN85_03335 [Luteolibacter pohnpeiensis]|uniref:Peptidase S1 domain-containing protein n=1 Tax=Luteolibacter pohnpeiensis TaxID=454153 RepID=A0A934S9T5_9BACT|nr:hypothetical protein [Luteolibacter pohnpeiensis]MBK1881433.1 hypothetical protein [Luteolibacter pohnpeiensis]
MIPARFQVSAFVGLLVFQGLTADSRGMAIRAYDATRHDRFTGFPGAPVWNDSAYYGSRNYTGVGWWTARTTEQFALVSPLHFVAPTHYLPSIGATIRFLNADGETVDRTVVSLTTVGGTDLTLATLSSPLLAADGVSFFPYLEKRSETSYLGTELVVFGATARGGRGVIDRFVNITESEEPTRTLRFTYNALIGDDDDAQLQVGDSGSPSFAVVDDKPALVGMHFAIDDETSFQYNYDTFIPNYIDELNELMAADGYQMTSQSPTASTVALAEVTPTSTLRVANPGSIAFTISNPGSSTASNAHLGITFPAGTGPSSIDSGDWIAEETGPDAWTFRIATLAPSTSVTFTANWEALPVAGNLTASVTLTADGADPATLEISHPLAASFAGWQLETGDSDLLDYAFGSQQRPILAIADSNVTIGFPVRTDSASRGLSYILESSSQLTSDSWTELDVENVIDNDSTDGEFLQRLITLPLESPKMFYRVRIELNE